MINYIKQIKSGMHMNFKLLTLSATLLLLGGCSTTFNNYYGNFKSECRNLPDNYINEKYLEEYTKAKSIYFEDLDNKCLHICQLLSGMERWDYIEAYLSKSNYDFPYENENLYKIYRDYDFKKCIKTPLYVTNKYENSKGSFCIAAEIIHNKTSNFSYNQKSKIKHETKTSKIRKTVTSINYKGIDIIKVNYISFDSSSMHDSCGINDKAANIIKKDF